MGQPPPPQHPYWSPGQHGQPGQPAPGGQYPPGQPGQYPPQYGAPPPGYQPHPGQPSYYPPPQPGQYPHPQYPQPHYQQPQYPQYGAPPGGPRGGGGGKTVAIVLSIVGGLVLLVGGGATAAYLAGAFDGGIGGGDPEQVVEDYFDALERGACDEMVDLVTESTWRQDGISTREEAVSECEEANAVTGPGPGAELDGTRLVSEEGDTAVVAATVAVQALEPGDDPILNDMDFTLRKEGGDWLLDLTIDSGL